MSEISFGRIGSRAVAIWLRGLLPFTALSCVCHVPKLAFALVGTMDGGEMPLATRVTLSTILTLLSSVTLDVAITDSMFRRLLGMSAPLGDSIRVGRGRLAAALVTSLPAYLAVYLSLVVPSDSRVLNLLKLVPFGASIAISVVLFVLVPVVVIEKLNGIAALRRAALLTKGYRWGLLGICVLLFVIAVGANILIRRLVQGAALAWVGPATAAFFAPLFASLSVVAYHDLRSVKEGRHISEVASIFD